MGKQASKHSGEKCRNCSVMYSRTCAYALRAMCRITSIDKAGYVSMHEICDGTDMPSQFISKILRTLTEAELLTSAKGRRGGFALCRPASQIALFDIVEAIDGVKQYTDCVVGLAKCDDRQPCSQHEQMKAVRGKILSYLKTTNLEVMSVALQAKEGILAAAAADGANGSDGAHMGAAIG